MSRSGSNRLALRAAVTAAAVLTAAAGANVIAQDLGEDDGQPPPPPGLPEAGQPVDEMRELEGGSGELVTTSGSTYDPTVLTKFISGPGFAMHQGADPYTDVGDYAGGGGPTCVRGEAAAPVEAGDFVDLNASVELPDGARIKRVKFYGRNSSATDTISVRLHRVRLTVPAVIGAVTRTTSTVNSFSVPVSSGITAVVGADDLDEIAGSRFAGVATGTEHNFHTVRVRMTNAAGADHRLCGVEIEYQVPTVADAGTVFHPVSPYRAYDSRTEMAPVDDGPLGAGPGRVIPVKDGRDVGTGVINLPEAIPATATAVAYTVTAASPTSSGFIFVGPGDAGSITASSLNWDTNTTGAIANSGIVSLDSARQLKVFADGSPGATTQFLIDITGYYAPAEYPNMGN